MDHIPRLSEAVYVGLCDEVGTPTEVRFRREVDDTKEVLMKPMDIRTGFKKIKSGSKREGFRLKTSDDDMMFCISNHKLICDLSQISLYRIPQQTVILTEFDDLPPGFTRLNLLSPSNNANIRSSCVSKNTEIYISSALFRFNVLKYLQNRHPIFASSVPHGPCSSNIKELGYEADILICLRSHHWPTTADPWIQRCRQQGWPSESVLYDILSGGFHVVPIGSIPEIGEEWRISFSQAEQKLVYSMNHCQFLCYGLLKIFLKEVINYQNNNPVLCSYFIKTILFWRIQCNNSLTWTPNNLLPCFWKCVKLLIHWVRIGECPNFFIPENNMFRVKVTGSVQTSLFSQLYDFYCKGISCLLKSDTLRPYLTKAILNRTLRVRTDESSITKSIKLDISFFEEVNLSETFCSCKDLAVYMNQIKRLMKQKLTPYQAVTLQCMTSGLLRNTALSIQDTTSPTKNRTVYYYTSKVTAMLKLSSTMGCVSDILYLCIYFYRTRRYEYSLSCLQKAQERMSVPYIVYRGNVNIGMYEHCMACISLDKKIRRALVFDIKLNNKITYIHELVLEQKISNNNGWTGLFIPPLVMLHMLFILNYHRLGDTVRSQQSLQDLNSLLLYDDDLNVPTPIRDISWQILGNCQQITGDYLGSLQSYQYSLQQYPIHKIPEATLIRMNTLHHEAMQY
ncbi:uncharacterized protein LOC133198373 [Saccostrea echinata]|uniref:uncharacterized protein LOC133198373 n=1 Tax=Saccostrea echinata TaxID=191078 RepID=UPI002A7F45DD|nr:uncharacterized protein LOC133198373 [Saccostrea echinata]